MLWVTRIGDILQAIGLGTVIVLFVIGTMKATSLARRAIAIVKR